jgi:hypothetical protein
MEKHKREFGQKKLPVCVVAQEREVLNIQDLHMQISSALYHFFFKKIKRTIRGETMVRAQ